MKTNESHSYLFETSWEVCNKVGGIYTVISTKVPNMQKIFGDNFFLIGPDVWREKTNHEFVEDKTSYPFWKENAARKGIVFRVGYWNIEGKPKVVLVDYKSLISRKDQILSEFWCDYQLDSLSGQWDYIEPVLFGYAAGKLIESFYECEVFPQEKVYAHFHEWMTGSGILYLKKALPAVATLFTTHATVLGRSIAGNSMPLYESLLSYQADELSHKFGVRAKYSMEKLSALEADAFTTVSELTNRECVQFFGKSVDEVTPNGFDDSFVPKQEDFEPRRIQAKGIIRKVSETLLNTNLDKDAFFVINSGRYEFRNKGIDLYIDALAKLNNEKKLKKQLVAYIAVPADSAGPREDLWNRLQQGLEPNGEARKEDYCTHYLNGSENDPIINRCREAGLLNREEDSVKIIFVPCYLDGSDGIFNLEYYDFLIGFDASVFPSYYEPWGYTPLESAAFSIPTLTTSLAGFGKWVQDTVVQKTEGVCVVERNDHNDEEVVLEIARIIDIWLKKDDEQIQECRKQAFEVSRYALWDVLTEHYKKAYTHASQKWISNVALLNKSLPKAHVHFSPVRPIFPTWKKVMVKPSMPQKLMKLEKLAFNLWWSWQGDAIELFRSIDIAKWEECGHNPLVLLSGLSRVQQNSLCEDEEFMKKMNKVYLRFENYMNQEPDETEPKVAYFSMEFGLHESLKIYSGGLGILAGDYLKAASDKNVDMVGIGLLYRYGYFQQHINANGEQIAEYIPQAFSKLPLIPERDENGEWVTISISLPGRVLEAKVWRVDVGRVPLYLLDTDIDLNNPMDKSITHQLYGGDWENRFKQELLLGIGGVRMLRKLGIKPDVYHCNEGHGAFMGLERLREYVEGEGLAFIEAVELTRSSTLFTTHTPVPAGHDAFSEDIIRAYISHYPTRLKISWEQFMALGRKDDESAGDKFSMSFLAAHLAEEINGVSRIHGRVSKDIFAPMYPGYYPEELDNIGYVTNGVHYRTWAHELWQDLYAKCFGKDFEDDISKSELWEKIQEVPDKAIMQIRNKLRSDLIDFLRRRMNVEMPRRGDTPQGMIKTLNNLNPKALTFGFARRFATYKRAHLLFSNIERLKSILCNPDRPVQIVFAGKAHPADKGGQALIRSILEISRMPDFLGKIIFVENYDIAVAKYLVQGVDVWLNTPTRPQEASGTSGEKAVMNGVLNLSVLDGWWAEGYKEGAGWALPEEKTYDNQVHQDQLDAETIYYIMEKQIIPAFYAQDKDGISEKWVKYIKNNISYVAPHFTMRRQINDYYSQYYYKINDRYKTISANNYEKAWNIAKWKLQMLNFWDDLKVVEYFCPESASKPLELGDIVSFGVDVYTGGINPQDIEMEIVFGQKKNDVVEEILYLGRMELKSVEDGIASFRAEYPIENSGVYDYAFRAIPKHPDIAHRQHTRLVKWL